MPKIPLADDTGRVRQQASAPVRVSTDSSLEAFGGGQVALGPSAAGQRVGGALMDYAVREKQKADETVIDDLAAQTTKMKNELFNEVLVKKQGKNAIGAVDEYLEKYEQNTDKIAEGAMNDAQRARYKRISTQVKSDLDGNLQRHMTVETMKYEDETAKNFIETHREDAIINYTVPGKVQESVMLQEDRIRRRGEDLGKDPEVIEDDVKRAQSKTYAGVIGRMLANDQDILAENTYKAAKKAGQIHGEDAVALDKAVEEGSMRAKTQRITDQLMDKTDTMSDALTQIRTMDEKGQISPKERDELTRRVRESYSLEEVAKRDVEEKLFREVWNNVETTMEKPDPVTWTKLSPTQQTAVEERIKKLKAGEPIATDRNKYYYLEQLAASDPQAFMKIDLLGEYGANLGNGDFEKFSTLQAGLRKGDESAKSTLDGIRNDTAIVNDALSQAGFDASPKPGSKDATQVAQFRSMVDNEVAVISRQTGKKPTNQEIQQVVDRLMVKGITDRGWIFNDRKRVFELDPGETLDFDIDDISKVDRAEIEQALTIEGKAVSEKAIIEKYARWINRSRRAN